MVYENNDFYIHEQQEEQLVSSEPPEQIKPKSPPDRILRFIMAQTVICGIITGAILISKFIAPDFYGYSKDKFNKYCNTPADIRQVLSLEQAKDIIAVQSTVYSVGGGYSDDASEYKRDYSQMTDEEASKADAAQLNSMCKPINGRVTSEYGYREHPITGELLFHTGIDLGADMGDEIACALDGTVKDIGYDENGYGNYIIINHAQGVDTLYAHCSEILKQVGDTVEKGEAIALAGSTGASTGPHLHFEVRINSIRLNPRWFLEF